MLMQPNDRGQGFCSLLSKFIQEEQLPEKENEIETFFKFIHMAKLTQEEADKMVNPISEEEIKRNILK